MKGDIALAGFVLTADEWEEIDPLSRAQMMADEWQALDPISRTQLMASLSPRPEPVGRSAVMSVFPEGSGRHSQPVDRPAQNDNDNDFDDAA